MSRQSGEPEISPLCFFKWCKTVYQVRRVVSELRLSQVAYLCKQLGCSVDRLADSICRKKGISLDEPLAGSSLFY